MSFWDFITSGKGEIAIAGLMGSAVSVAMEWNGVVSGIRRLFIGSAAAYFLSPVGVPLFQWTFGQISIPAENAAGVGGFVTGIAGVILIEIFLNLLRIRKSELGKVRNDQG